MSRSPSTSHSRSSSIQVEAGPSRQTRNTSRTISVDDDIPPSDVDQDLDELNSKSGQSPPHHDTISSDPLAFSEGGSPINIKKGLPDRKEGDEDGYGRNERLFDDTRHTKEEGSKNLISHTRKGSLFTSKPSYEYDDEYKRSKISVKSISRHHSKSSTSIHLTSTNTRKKRNRSPSKVNNQDEHIIIDSDSDLVSNSHRRRPIVEIPLMPLNHIRRYLHLRRDTETPTERSRRKLPDLRSESELHSSSDTASVVVINKRKRRESSVSYGYEEDGDGEMSEDESDMGSDQIALRRSGRSGRKNGRRGIYEDDGDSEIAERTRARRPIHIPRQSSLSTFSSSDSDSRSYKANPKGKGKAKMGNNTNKCKHKALSSDDDEFNLISMSSDQDDTNESDISDYSKPNKGKGKGKGKSSGWKLKVTQDDLYTHRGFCEKCSREPADEILDKAINRKNRKKKRKRNEEDDDMISDEELANMLEGWLECEKCVVSSHWGCLTPTQRKDVLADIREREGTPAEGEKPRKKIAIDEAATFVCAKCALNPDCFVCHKDEIKEKASIAQDKKDVTKNGDEEDEKMDVDEPEDQKDGNDKDEEEIPKFRCLRCKQCVHYEHLDVPLSLAENPSLPEVAFHYQHRTEEGDAWICHQCRAWIWTIIAWRPSPPNAIEPELEEDEKANWKDPLPREYLVKWTGRGFRHVTWVPHPWLQVLSSWRLRHFLEKGPNLDLITDETLAAKGDEMVQPTISKLTAEDDQVSGRKSGHSLEHVSASQEGKKEWKGIGPGPEKDAESSLPIEWSTIDRVLDVMLLPPRQRAKLSTTKRGKRIMSTSLSASASETGQGNSSALANGERSPADEMRRQYGLRDGQKPPAEMQMDIDTWEEKAGRELDEDDVDEVAGLVTWCFVKWDDLQYDQSTWDTPPPTDSPLYPAFKHALARFLRSRKIEIPVLTPNQVRLRDTNAEGLYVPPTNQPDCIVGGQLMPFQMEGFQWLLYKHFRRESCILADDMGLGKTIQIASVLGYLGSSKYKIYPCLVVVPNSTITNWVREFEKWVPHMRVVPYYGESASRKVISKYELYHKGMQNKAEGLNAHVVLTTYDMITGHEFRVFRNIPRWEVLCVDEGQRLKSDNSLIFNRLKTLNSVHRILMTGTPLNNNLRELFNLLNFLDPTTFRQLEDLEKRFENLNESLVTELHEMIKPYILRRIKADVLKLPPKIEIIVPISLTAIQKQIYKGVFEKNSELIQAILRARKRRMRLGR
ncbi:hypothetical protein I204_06024 [Kwoniella mangroviensis CBS 8886]|nr:hypothetical protein I204_06024 [Kwoniella mangroviensis CBS 8886]